MCFLSEAVESKNKLMSKTLYGLLYYYMAFQRKKRRKGKYDSLLDPSWLELVQY